MEYLKSAPYGISYENGKNLCVDEFKIKEHTSMCFNTSILHLKKKTADILFMISWNYCEERF